MLTLRGAPALSAFRLDKLARKLSAIHPKIKLLHTEFVHFADLTEALSSERKEILAKLLEYGPTISEEGHVGEGESSEHKPTECHFFRDATRRGAQFF